MFDIDHTPRIYVACLASYNAGILHGRWIDASTDVDAMQDEINAMLAASPCPDAEEWAFHDYEGLGDLGEYAGLEEVARRVTIAETAAEWQIPAYILIQAMQDLADKDEDPGDFMSERYRGVYDNWADLAQQLTEETQDMAALPDWVRNHIDWEGMGRDFELSGDFSAWDMAGEMHFFWAH